jgi:hypothetical protein
MRRHEAEQEVRGILIDAKENRDRGGSQSDVDVLREKLIEALSQECTESVRK